MLLKWLPLLWETKMAGVHIKHRNQNFGGSAVTTFVQNAELLLLLFRIYSTAGYEVTLKPKANIHILFNPKLNGKTACMESNRVQLKPSMKMNKSQASIFFKLSLWYVCAF